MELKSIKLVIISVREIKMSMIWSKLWKNSRN